MLALVLRSNATAQQAPTAPFAPGETLTYDLSWEVFPAGQVSGTILKVTRGSKELYEVKAAAQSRGFVSLLYTVEDEFDSFFDPETLCSDSLQKRINEGRRHKNTRIVFDSARKLAILDEQDLAAKGAPTKHAENEIPACVHDVVNAFYFMRRQPLRVGQEIRLPINDGSKTADVRVQVQALETIRTPFGTRSAFRVEPTVFGGLLKRKGRMQIWFSDDAERLPLRVKAMISAGTITADLHSVTHASASAPAPSPKKP
ncbi:MAG TPA: DUF3108 domain-containing protein [Terriglobia bacterium]|nr:DUF3108 domain-containing protein [Terriglobia bacterium]